MKKLLALTVMVIMTFGMIACDKDTANVQPSVTQIEDKGVISGTEYSISQTELQKYQLGILEEQDYYCDAYEEDDSPLFCFIASINGKETNYRIAVSDIEADNAGKVTITVFADKSQKGQGREDGYGTVVEMYPMPKAVKVVDTEGNELTGK